MENFCFDKKWTEKHYKEFLACLESIGEEKYRAFHLSLIPGEDRAFGIRAPKLKEIAKNISKGDADGFLKVCKNNFHDEIMIKGLVISSIKDEKRLVAETESFIPLIRNWAICDSFCSALKVAKKKPSLFMPLIKKCLESDKEYDLRFACVMLLDHYITDEYIDYVSDVYEGINSGYYYVKMAVAWGLSVCFVKYPEKTLDTLNKGSLDTFTHNKTIQKICESLRVDKDTKNNLKKLKRNVDKG